MNDGECPGGTPIAADLPSNRSQGATSAFLGVGPVLPPIARREVGGSGQSMVEAALEAKLSAILGAMLAGRWDKLLGLLYFE